MAMKTKTTTGINASAYGQYGGYGGYGPAQALRQQRTPYQQIDGHGSYEGRVRDSSKVSERRGEKESQSMFFCEGLGDWLKPEASNCRGLAVSRPGLVTRDEYQEIADEFMAAYPSGDVSIEECVDVPLKNPDAALELYEKKAQQLFGGLRLPQKLIDQMIRDAVDLMETMSKLVPDVKHMHLKLQSFGKARCKNWHQDNYVARALVCYCGPGTEYVEASNLDWGAFRRLHGKSTVEENKRVIKDLREVKSMNTGDIILMKGIRFPDRAGGLVHKSPEPEYYPDGRIMNRLCLKVDI
eukprot:TRINITY_DN91154_c0_g1_i1.p1 TRINITY_DN91154_c0_g1~~TRINITY_DN91154_c0_g1_i1.p1  ORF type:complete len:297 (-),score=50.88 TRINITY_DN91154_c0_g1_i1:423-1313(-)